MKAAILEHLNSPLVVADLTLPKELLPGQVLVKVRCSTICGAQLGEISGAKGTDPYLPHLLGHEGVGDVEFVGPGVRHVKPGDRVVMHWRKGVGIEAEPPRYYWPGEGHCDTVGGGWVTTFNEQAVVSENRLTVIDKDVPDYVASLMGCAITTGLGLINNEAQLKIGQTIAVAGCGGVGWNVIQGASMASASKIIAIDVEADKVRRAKTLGATDVVTLSDPLSPMLDNVRAIVGKRGVDVFVDCTGNPAVIARGLELVAPGGRLILVGQPHCDYAVEFPRMRQHYCGKTILDSQGGLTNPTVDIPRYIELFKMGKLVTNVLVTDTFKLDNVNDAIKLARSGSAGRVLLEMN